MTQNDLDHIVRVIESLPGDSFWFGTRPSTGEVVKVRLTTKGRRELERRLNDGNW